MRSILLVAAVLALPSCYTAKIGSTVAELDSSCRASNWRPVEVSTLHDGRQIANCAGLYSIIENGLVAASISPDDANALKDESQCLEFGVEPATELYFSCRMMLAQIRATEASTAAINQQATQDALLNAQMWLQSTQPQRSMTNCTAYTQGAFTNYRCN